ncbi:hypothetical protein D6833_09590 [Candidatus Parcubacteria bacterium]|nr:MAG: hypothetical protein D6833_09590 [Candidatus Parcubacteria bacterium]
MTVMVIATAWLVVCAVFDLLTPAHVPGYITWPGVFIALGLRLTGVLVAPWWQIGIVFAMSVSLWMRGVLGAADSRGWLVITAVGGLSGFAWATLGAAAFLPIYRRLRPGVNVPGFPGYALGFAAWVLTSMAYVHIIGTG